MIFHEKFFQCLAGAIPLFLTPQKIGLLKYINKILRILFFDVVRNYREMKQP